ncbi:nuclear transport factor 2 family protein [Acinetobacter venetianus]|jgi:hypothetical protein|uniref:Nuclear transport factor 2 family protein n=1 Tax=Acinetobacter venetianus TaxID=52133 RepID=A0A150HU95_9GAMM|nr:nuclear transport factor 2 family protein [Acinetobacter venetianus]KXZ70065.1 hypothetical protein AVENLUH13518_02047 [Acinetobacter venetianus]
MKLLRTLAVSTLTLLSLAACKSVPSYTADYEKAKKEITGIMLDDQQAQKIGQNFVAAFNTMGTENFVKNASQLYADQLFINDTLSQFSNKQDLIKHFEGMNEHVSNVSVTLISATHKQDSAYIHWHMVYDFKMFGRTKTMSSYGISQIKINQQKLIIFQQDFWDPANGLYRSLPYVGSGYSLTLPFKK